VLGEDLGPSLSDIAKRGIEGLARARKLTFADCEEGFKKAEAKVRAEKAALNKFNEQWGEIISNDIVNTNEIDLIGETIFAYDVKEIFGELAVTREGGDILSAVPTFSLTMMNLIHKVQETQKQGNSNLFVTKERLTDDQKTVLRKFFGVTVADGQFITADGYEKETEGRRVVAMLGKSLKDTLAGAHKKGDRVLLAEQEDNDFRLLANMAIVAASTKGLEEIKNRFRELFQAYYKGTPLEQEIEEWISKIDDVNGVIRILLPPMSPFVQDYYNALKQARDLIFKAA